METSKILVQGIKLYAYHGCLTEEAIIGGNYEVNVSLEANLDKATKSDSLEDTIDYCKIHEIVKDEMAVRSKLIEHVTKRIMEKLKEAFPSLLSLEVNVTKINPPIPGEVEAVTVSVSEK